jgi:hypothetical protein
MAENRPHRPFAAHVDVMQRPFLVQAGVCGIRVLQNCVAENNFFARRNSLHLLVRLEFSSWRNWRRNWWLTDVEFTIVHSALTNAPIGRRCQINSKVWIFPFTGVGGVINTI